MAGAPTLTFSDAVLAPVDVGVKTTFTVQLAVGASDAGQLLVCGVLVRVGRR